MRVLQILSIPRGSRNSISGPERRTGNLLEYWGARGVEIVVAYPKDGLLIDLYREQAAEVVEIPPAHRITISALLRLLFLLSSGRIDLVHIQGPPPLDFLSSLLCKIAGVPLVITRPVLNRDLVSHSGSRRQIYNILDMVSFSLGEAIVCVSNNGMKGLIGEFPEIKAKCVLIRNGIKSYSMAFQGERNYSPNRPLCIGMVGQLSGTKGWEDFIEVIARLRSKGWGICSRVVGDGPLWDSLRLKVQEQNLSGCISFSGFVEDVSLELKNLDIFFFPSKREGLSVAVLEAMASGLPVVATRVSGTSEQVINGETGFLVNPGDREAMAHFLEILLADSELRRRFGERARKHIRQAFTEERMFAQHLKLYMDARNSL